MKLYGELKLGVLIGLTLRELMQLKNLYHQMRDGNLQEFQRYVIAGLINTFISFLVYAVCVELTPLPFWAANFCAMIAGIICGFFLARHYVFAVSDNPPFKTLPKYVLTIGLQFIVSTALIAAFRKLGLSDILSYIACLPFIIALSFGLQKTWVFQPYVESQ